MERKLPIGIQDFAKIREESFLYVDKTARIHELLTGSGGVFFLSRPRRFGKSLLCSTLGALFEGRRELFGPIAGQPPLAIEGLPWEWKKRPVVRIDLNAGDYSQGLDELYETVNVSLEACAEKYGTPLDGETLSGRFTRLLRNISSKHNERAAVIIMNMTNPC